MTLVDEGDERFALLFAYVMRLQACLRFFREGRRGAVRRSPGPNVQDFSGSCTVTSRNPLIHNGATTATKSERFGAGGLHQGLLSRG
jgi:hypothetical protein